jgi:hypothetical protein
MTFLALCNKGQGNFNDRFYILALSLFVFINAWLRNKLLQLYHVSVPEDNLYWRVKIEQWLYYDIPSLNNRHLIRILHIKVKQH